jgi:recombination protein RecT
MNNQLTQNQNTNVATAATDRLDVALQKMMPQLKASLPAHIKPERIIRIALNAAQNTPKLMQCDQKSFLLAVLRSAQLGLEPDGTLGQAYLIPFGDKVQLIVGYKGLIDLARRSGEVSNIIAKEVCANDDFKLQWHEEIPFKHEQSTTNNRGEIIGFWAMARFKDGGFHFDYMSVAEVNAIRDGSQGYQMAKRYAKNGVINSPWESNYIEMGKKTAIRRIAKYLPMSIEKASMVEELSEQGKNFNIIDGDIILDNEQEVKKPAVNAVSALEAAAQPAQPFDTATGEIIEQLNDTETSPVEADAPAEEAKPFLTMSEIVALPYTNQTQIKELCKQAGRSIENGTIEKMEFFLTFPDLPDAAKKTGAYPAFEKLTKL